MVALSPEESRCPPPPCDRTSNDKDTASRFIPDASDSDEEKPFPFQVNSLVSFLSPSC